MRVYSPIVIPMTVDVSPKPIELSLDVAIRPTVYDGELETYDGSYRIDPSFDQQTLETAGKAMMNDVVVEAIIVSRTTNASGGRTIYIGGRLDG